MHQRQFILIADTKRFAGALRRCMHMLPPWQENTSALAEAPTAYLQITASADAPTEPMLQVSHSRRTLQIRENVGLYAEGISSPLALPFWTLFLMFNGRQPTAETQPSTWPIPTVQQALERQKFYNERKQISPETFRQVLCPTDTNAFGYLACSVVEPRQLKIPMITEDARLDIHEDTVTLTCPSTSYICHIPLGDEQPEPLPTWHTEQIVGQGETFYDCLYGKRRYMTAFPVTLTQKVLWEPSATAPVYLFETKPYLALGCSSQRLFIVKNNA